MKKGKEPRARRFLEAGVCRSRTGNTTKIGASNRRREKRRQNFAHKIRGSAACSGEAKTSASQAGQVKMPPPSSLLLSSCMEEALLASLCLNRLAWPALACTAAVCSPRRARGLSVILQYGRERHRVQSSAVGNNFSRCSGSLQRVRAARVLSTSVTSAVLLTFIFFKYSVFSVKFASLFSFEFY